MSPITEADAKHIHDLLRNRATRDQAKEFVIEGPHLMEVALQKAKSNIRLVGFTEDAINRHADLLVRSQVVGAQPHFINARLSRKLSDTEQPQGIFAVIKYPETRSVTGDLVLALDAVQDPGNVGTLVRTAAWFGVKTILFGEGTADPFSPKVVRSTQGAIWSVNAILRANLRDRVSELKSQGYRILGSTLAKDAKSLYDLPSPGKSVLLLGSEAHGLHPELEHLCDTRIIIPRVGEGESLNVAVSGAILLAELGRKW